MANQNPPRIKSKKQISHRERLETVLSGATPDRTPIALWRHFPGDDQTPAGLVEATLDFQTRYDFDLVKVTPASSFCLKDWGSRDEWRGNQEGTRDYVHRVVQSPEDWYRLNALDPRKGYLGAQLEALTAITQKAGSQLPVLQTIFSPMAQAKNLVGGADLLIHMRRNPDDLHAGLRRITQTTLDFLSVCIPTGIAGIFFAVQHAQYSLLSQDEFIEFGMRYDLEILNAARSLWLNMAHLHGEEVMFDLLCGYPIQAINWHDRDTRPGLAEALDQFPGVLCGGLSRWETTVLGTPETIREQVRDAIQATGGKRLMIGTGCVLPITAPSGNIRAAREAVEA